MKLIEQLRAAHEAATPGPWVSDTCGEGNPYAIVTSTHIPDGPDDDVCEVYGGNDNVYEVRVANNNFIALAHNHMPDLLAVVEAAQNLVAMKGRHNTEVAYGRLTLALNQLNKEHQS